MSSGGRFSKALNKKTLLDNFDEELLVYKRISFDAQKCSIFSSKTVFDELSLGSIASEEPAESGDRHE